MKKKNTNRGRRLTVEDRSKLIKAVERGELTPAEFEKMFADLCRKGKLLNTAGGKKYQEEFGTPEFFLGASNAGTIMGLDMFKSRAFLQYELLGLVKSAVSEKTAWNFLIGHESEEYVGRTCTRLLSEAGTVDAIYKPDVKGYIHTRWPHVLVHPDGWIIDRTSGKALYLGEVKTSSEKSPYWINDFSRDLIPGAYQCQVQVEMQILGIKECYVLAWAKNCDGPESFRPIKLVHDKERAVEILDSMEKFYEDTVAGIFYDDEPLLPAEAALLYKEVDRSLGYVELPKKHEKTLANIASLAEEKAQLKAEIAEAEADIREIDKELKLEKSRLYGSIGKAPGATFSVGDDTYRIEVRRRFSFDDEVKAMVEEEFPEAWEAIKSYKPTISTRLVKTSSANAEEETIDVVEVE